MADEEPFYPYNGDINNFHQHYPPLPHMFGGYGGPVDDEKQEHSFGYNMLAMLTNDIAMGDSDSVSDFKYLLEKARKGLIQDLKPTEWQKAKIFDILISNRKTQLLELFIDVGKAFGCGANSSCALENYMKVISTGDLELIKLFERKNIQMAESHRSKLSLVQHLMTMVQIPGEEFSTELMERMEAAKAIWLSHIEGKLDFSKTYIKAALMRELTGIIVCTSWQDIQHNCRIIWFLREHGILFNHTEAIKLGRYAWNAWKYAIKHLSWIKVEILDPRYMTGKTFSEYFRQFGWTEKVTTNLVEDFSGHYPSGNNIGWVLYVNPASAIRACCNKDPRFKVTRWFDHDPNFGEKFHENMKEHSEDIIEYLVEGGLPVANWMFAYQYQTLSRLIRNGLNTFALTELSDTELQKILGLHPYTALEIMDFLVPRRRKLGKS